MTRLYPLLFPLLVSLHADHDADIALARRRQEAKGQLAFFFGAFLTEAFFLCFACSYKLESNEREASLASAVVPLTVMADVKTPLQKLVCGGVD